MKQTHLLRLMSFLVMLSFAELLFAAPVTLESLTVKALGPADGRAVLLLPEGKMVVLKIGDTIPGTQARIIQVLHDKVVVEEHLEEPGKAPVNQLIWIYKQEKGATGARVQRFDQNAPEKAGYPTPSISVSK